LIDRFDRLDQFGLFCAFAWVNRETAVDGSA